MEWCGAPWCLYPEAVFEAVGGGFFVSLPMLLPSFAEEQSVLVQEEVALHGLEARQLLHPGGALLMADPHAEGALHQHSAQITQIPLCAMQDSTKQCYTLQYNSAQYNKIQYNTTLYSSLEQNTIQHNTILYRTIQHNTIQHKTILYSSIQRITIQ